MQSSNKPLIIAGILSTLAGFLHLGIIIGGPDWYRFFGAGEGMAQMAEKGMTYPAIAAASIALALFIWAAYAFSGAGVIRKLPLLKTGLITISIIFFIRSLFGIAFVNYVEHPYYNELAARPIFMWVTSAICLIYALLFAIGTFKRWSIMSSAK